MWLHGDLQLYPRSLSQDMLPAAGTNVSFMMWRILSLSRDNSVDLEAVDC